MTRSGGSIGRTRPERYTEEQMLAGVLSALLVNWNQGQTSIQVPHGNWHEIARWYNWAMRLNGRPERIVCCGTSDFGPNPWQTGGQDAENQERG